MTHIAMDSATTNQQLGDNSNVQTLNNKQKSLTVTLVPASLPFTSIAFGNHPLNGKY